MFTLPYDLHWMKENRLLPKKEPTPKSSIKVRLALVLYINKINRVQCPYHELLNCYLILLANEEFVNLKKK